MKEKVMIIIKHYQLWYFPTDTLFPLMTQMILVYLHYSFTKLTYIAVS
jgi:hypothetical protein